jgi:DNA-binding transcriptional MerR regulator
MRPKSPAPRDGFVISNIARLTGVPVRTLRDYVRRGLLRHSELRGTLTRYPQREVMRLVVALRLKAQTKVSWAEIKRRIDAFDEARLRAWLGEQSLPPALAAELGLAAPTHDSVSAGASTSSGPPMEQTGECWHRLVLMPGLELFLSAGASLVVKSAARRILEEQVRQIGLAARG